MSAESELVLWALDEASKPRKAIAPEALLAAAAADADPIGALSDIERANALFNALTEEFGFIPYVRATQKPPPEDMQQRIAGLLRWVVEACAHWQLKDDPHFRTLVSIFVVTRYCGYAANIWDHFPDEGGNAGLRGELSALFTRLKFEIKSQGVRNSPIADAEALMSFKLADEQGDWAALAERLRHLDSRMSQKTLTTEAVGYLRRFDRQALISALSVIKQTVLMKHILEPLSKPDACEVALASNNPYCEFGATLKCAILASGGRKTEEAPELQGALTRLISKVALDELRWRQWMLAFNRHPQYYSGMAEALGLALTTAPASAIGAYVESIALTNMQSLGRSAVATTLAAFREAASLERRQSLWKCAYDRWQEWNFGLSQEGIALISIGHCELDFALVGYALECMSKAECQDALRGVRAELSELGSKWFKTVNEFGKEKNRLLSFCQPFAHAAADPTDWLAQSDYLPYFPDVDRYAALALSII